MQLHVICRTMVGDAPVADNDLAHRQQTQDGTEDCPLNYLPTVLPDVGVVRIQMRTELIE